MAPVKTPIYLDYAATTPADPAVVAVMTRHLGPDGVFGNPASRRHGFGRDAEEAVERARVHVVNLRFACVESESLMTALPDLSFSTGSACTSARVEPSHVLRALGLDDEAAHGSLRFSFGRFTTAGEVDYAARRVREAVAELRAISPDWHAACSGSDSRAADNPAGAPA